MKPKTKALFESHVATFLFASVAIVIKFTASPLFVVTAGRSFFAALALMVFLWFKKESIKLENRRDYFFLLLLGIIQTVQWLTIFKAIRLADITTALLALYTFPLFVTFMEPLVYREKLSCKAVISAISIIVGIALIMPAFNLGNQNTVGALWALGSALLVSIMLLMHRHYIQKYKSETITFYKTATASFILLPLIFVMRVSLPEFSEISLFAILGVFMTAIPYVLFIESFKKIKAQQASVVLSMEVVYGVVLAILFFQEIPSVKTCLGGLIITLTAVFTHKDK